MRGDVPYEMFLVTDFVNLKIKSTQSFRGAHRNRMYTYAHRDEYSYIYEYLQCLSKKPCSCMRSVRMRVISSAISSSNLLIITKQKTHSIF
jgi:hypothetical protein